MKTKTTVRITANVDEIAFGYWDEGKGEWIEPQSTDEVLVAAERLGCSTDLIVAITMFVESAVDAISADLRDIWKRLDAIDALLDS